MLSLAKELNTPMLSPLPRRHWWVLRQDWEMYGIKIPEGFACDLDSIPKLPFIYLLLKGRARKSALLHDYLYATGLFSRDVADMYFHKAMLDEGVSKHAASVMYWAVRLFGKGNYMSDYSHQKEDSVEERKEKFCVDSQGDVKLFKEE